ncbi:DUF6461 domain-containing protein [Streptomyces atratus]|uniref:DUF6461 domain-containing protein n=1 Tax=Streptomyces atratus TaxID=1893 RepID=UPI00338F262F
MSHYDNHDGNTGGTFLWAQDANQRLHFELDDLGCRTGSTPDVLLDVIRQTGFEFPEEPAPSTTIRPHRPPSPSQNTHASPPHTRTAPEHHFLLRQFRDLVNEPGPCPRTGSHAYVPRTDAQTCPGRILERPRQPQPPQARPCPAHTDLGQDTKYYAVIPARS